EGVKPRHALDFAQGTWGAVELGVRYNWLKVDSAAFPTAADPAKSVSKAQGFGVALNWQLSRNLKASANYEQTSFDGGAAAGGDPAGVGGATAGAGGGSAGAGGASGGAGGAPTDGGAGGA